MKPNFNEGGTGVATRPGDDERSPASQGPTPKARRAILPSGARGWVWSIVLHGAVLAVGVATAAGPMLARALASEKDVVIKVGFGEAGGGGEKLSGERAAERPLGSTSQVDDTHASANFEATVTVPMPFDFAPTTPRTGMHDVLGMGGAIALPGSRTGRNALIVPARGASEEGAGPADGAGGANATAGGGGGSATGSGSGSGSGAGNGGTTFPVAESCPPPAYPESARKRGWEGTVRIEYTINSAGAVESARVIAGSGHDLLDEAGLATVRTWRYRWTGTPVRAYTTSVRFVFELR